MGKIVFGVDIGGTTVKMGLFSGEGELLEKWEVKTEIVENDNCAILRDIAGAIEEKLREHGIDREDVLGVGMGVPGPVLADGTVNKCVNLKWGVFNLEKTMSDLTGIPVKAGNDANVAALGEQFRGGGEGFRNVVMVTLGTGVGAGVIIGGHIIPGAFGAAGEVGHIHVRDDESDTCGCGNHGCLEQYASANGIKRVKNRYLAAHSEEPTVLRELDDPDCKEIFRVARGGDRAALAVVDTYFDILGWTLAQIAAVVDPDAFVIGGGVSKEGPYLTEGIARAYKKYCFHASRNTRIMLAKLGNDSGIYGACGMILAG